jgi:hypothetical protein
MQVQENKELQVGVRMSEHNSSRESSTGVLSAGSSGDNAYVSRWVSDAVAVLRSTARRCTVISTWRLSKVVYYHFAIGYPFPMCACAAEVAGNDVREIPSPSAGGAVKPLG